jgi:hypothetical protein
MDRKLRVLLWKDWLTLRRNWAFLILFFVLPTAMMCAFWYLETLIDVELSLERHNLDQTRYTKLEWTKQSFLNSDMKRKHRNSWNNNVTAVIGCKKLRRVDIGVVAPKSFREPLVALLTHSMNNNYKFHGYETAEELQQDVMSNLTREYCFGFELSDVRPGIEEVNLTMMFPRDVVPDTHQPVYDLT